ncbi:ORF63 [Felid gammaherpesvirus 1]|uniref:ORF63 n=1 Tax=Felid gammaherpesvirus 1 TaxID=2560468 RepID=A0A0M4MPX1_9GAMA|nr:ORF63 [Felis catus gammaherpesvirus 1]ALE14778.1 ORF63 [Felis catus gammaherpesvirus 1]
MNSLQKVTQNLLGANNSLKKIKELVELELRPLNIEDLIDSETVINFLNTLKLESNAYLTFISTYPIFFLLRVSTFTKMPFRRCTLTDYIGVMQEVHKSLSHITLLPEVDPAVIINNKSILLSLQHFITHLKDIDISTVPFYMSIPNTFVCFKWVEDVVLFAYETHWAKPPIIELSSPLTPDRPLIELWLVTSYFKSKSLLKLDKSPTLQDLADKLLKTHSKLFISFSSSTEDLCLLPIAKQHADNIFQIFSGDTSHLSGTPILGFLDEDLIKLNPEYMFLYDFIFEALFHNISHQCSDHVINKFLIKCDEFLQRLSNKIQKATQGKSPFALQEVESIRLILAQCALDINNCSTFCGLLSIAHQTTHTRWYSMASFLTSLHYIVIFGNLFYQGLQKCSPSSTSFNFLENLFRRANLEAEHANQQLGLVCPFPWTVSSTLKILQPEVPEKQLFEIATNISSAFMRSLLGVAAHRDWRLNTILKYHNTFKNSVTSTMTNVSYEQVKAFCKQLKVGDSQYSIDITSHPQFALEFTRYQVLPTLLAILENTVQRNQALVHIRWLIAFAVEDAPGLFHIKRSLTLVYFELTHILLQSEGSGSISTLLYYIQDLWNIIQGMIPDSPAIPTLFINYLYNLMFTPLATNHMEAPKLFLREVSNVLQRVHLLIRIGFVFCHTPYSYNSQFHYIKIPTENGKLTVPIDTFKNTVKALEQNVHSCLTLLADLHRGLNSAYIDCLNTIERVDEISKHLIKINTSALNFKKIKKHYLQCFHRYYLIIKQVFQSCSFNLTSHFNFLFLPDLLPIEIVEQILNFSEASDNPKMFLKSIEQPVDPDIHMISSTSKVVFKQSDLIEIQQLFPLFNRNPIKKQSIKLHYTDAYDIASPKIDWEKLTHGSFVSKNTEIINYNHLTFKQIERLIFTD